MEDRGGVLGPRGEEVSRQGREFIVGQHGEVSVGGGVEEVQRVLRVVVLTCKHALLESIRMPE